MIDTGRITQAVIQQNLVSVLEKIERAARDSGRDPNSVKLVVVTKKQPVDVMRVIIEAGATNLGENYAEEALAKIESLSGYLINWHMIGHVQSRKAEIVCQYFDYVHSLDSIKLAERYDRLAGQYSRKLPVLLQFNVSGEGTKSGWDAWKKEQWELFLPDMERIVALDNLDLCGVMTMPPYTENPEDSRPFFRLLVELRAFLSNRFPHAKWDELSMGMSGDFEVAIQEGATWVRIGQAILGPRLSV